MESKDLTREQAEELGDRIRPMLRYIGAVLERMTTRGFNLDDPLVDATRDAYGGLIERPPVLEDPAHVGFRHDCPHGRP
jgi:hypothetical protein